MALTEHQVHCLHCGKEVDIVTTDDPEKSISSNGHPADIVQPPAGFADSPRVKQGRLYKKLEKRFRSEERPQAERRHHRYRHDVRAKVSKIPLNLKIVKCLVSEQIFAVSKLISGFYLVLPCNKSTTCFLSFSLCVLISIWDSQKNEVENQKPVE